MFGRVKQRNTGHSVEPQHFNVSNRGSNLISKSFIAAFQRSGNGITCVSIILISFENCNANGTKRTEGPKIPQQDVCKILGRVDRKPLTIGGALNESYAPRHETLTTCQICMPAVEQKLSKEKAGSYPQHSLERSLLEGISVQSPSGLELYPFWTDSIQRREGRG